MREKFGPEEFDFCPTTYILPRQRDELVRYTLAPLAPGIVTNAPSSWNGY